MYFVGFVICVISMCVSKDLVHELPSTPGLSSSSHSAVFQGHRALRTTTPPSTLLLATGLALASDRLMILFYSIFWLLAEVRS